VSKRKKRIFVVGDVMLDHYVYGSVRRISPEAPVPIIEFENEKFVPGGAANVAANLVALGADVELFGIVGKDSASADLEQTLKEFGILDGYFLEEKGRQTTVKQRIVCGQQVVRVDRESHRRLTEKQESTLILKIKAAIHRADAVVISDYAKGVVTQAVVDFIIGICARRKIPVMMNLKPGHTLTPSKPFAIQVNRKEAFELAVTFDDGSWPRLREAASMLAIRYEPRVIIITLGADGVYLYKVSDGEPVHIKTVAKEVVDVSGAGDTVLAAYTVGLLDGLDSKQALEFANRAAGKVVAKHGTATVKRDEL
jgi:rfaE bifunctional protein kinase chain/domain